ncbi:hypothetical protein [Filimonas effusa]|uniref:Uncharacterized protein n=1 Tax=Filimonas effusa TaxID=2508721 RepID=A0A4Q1CZJ6_9BACT|nr:hypothetical protein [Filimonas effusa]RXK80830.1 hypothetical protein ESB13_21990 [Filimonas effusa]
MREVYKAFVERMACPKWLQMSVLAIALLLSATKIQAQMKIGDNPTRINKSSVLELESTNQGFLLPRIGDTAAINLLTPPDATMIYFTDPSNTSHTNAGIYIRKTTGGVPAWFKLAYNAEDRGWTMGGNTIDPSLFPKALLGTLNQRSVNFITNNLVRMTIDSVTGKVTVVDSLTVGGALNVGGRVILGNKLSVADSAMFAAKVTAGKNLSVTDTLFSKVAKFTDSLYLTHLKGGSLLNTVLVQDTVTGTVERRNMPADLFKGWTIGNVDTSSYPTALQRITGQNLNRDTLIIHGATFTAPGVITTGTQPIAGTKVLRDSLLVGGASTDLPNSTLQVGGSVSMNILSVSASTTLNEKHHTVVADGNVVITLPNPVNAKGRIYIIKGSSTVSTSAPVSIVGTVDGTVKTAGDALYIYNAGTVRKLQSNGVDSWFLVN